MQPRDLVRQLGGAQVPEAQRAIKVAADCHGAVHGQAHCIDRGGLEEGIDLEASAEIPNLQASVPEYAHQSRSLGEGSHTGRFMHNQQYNCMPK